MRSNCFIIVNLYPYYQLLNGTSNFQHVLYEYLESLTVMIIIISFFHILQMSVATILIRTALLMFILIIAIILILLIIVILIPLPVIVMILSYILSLIIFVLILM